MVVWIGYTQKCVGASGEWHLNFAKTLEHFPFDLLPRSCQAVMVFRSSFRHARLKAIGAIGDALSADCLWLGGPFTSVFNLLAP